MGSRMTKYYDEDETMNSRYQRNEELYKEISKSDLGNFEIKSNAVVLGENKNEIDIEKIKKILDTKYNEVPKRKSIKLEEEETVKEEKEITKEYDINVILEKARDQKTDNYDEERFKKLHNTQFDILKKLEINQKEKDEEEEKEIESSEENLQNLINTIAFNESHNSETDSALDILSDLKGSGKTETLKGLKEEIEKAENENNNSEEKDPNESTKMINSFYTSSNAIKQKDFEDIEDFTKEIESNNGFIKVIITLIILVFIIGIVILVKTIYFK